MLISLEIRKPQLQNVYEVLYTAYNRGIISYKFTEHNEPNLNNQCLPKALKFSLYNLFFIFRHPTVIQLF